MTGNLNILYNNLSDSSKTIIPQTAVCYSNETGPFVWKITEQNRVKKTPVSIGKLVNNDKIEILSGLSNGERIAASGLLFLSENEKITIQEQ